MDKKKILIIMALCLFVMASCDKSRDDGTYNPSYEPRTYVIDSCEYIGWLSGYSSVLAHKGNCKYCEERRKKEMAQWISKN